LKTAHAWRKGGKRFSRSDCKPTISAKKGAGLELESVFLGRARKKELMAIAEEGARIVQRKLAAAAQLSGTRTQNGPRRSRRGVRAPMALDGSRNPSWV